MLLPSVRLFFFFNDTATTEIYTLSLHDALPILRGGRRTGGGARRPLLGAVEPDRAREHGAGAGQPGRGGAQSAGDPRGRPCRGPPRRGGAGGAWYRRDGVLPGPARRSGAALLAGVRAVRGRRLAPARPERPRRHSPHVGRCHRGGTGVDRGRAPGW